MPLPDSEAGSVDLTCSLNLLQGLYSGLNLTRHSHFSRQVTVQAEAASIKKGKKERKAYKQPVLTGISHKLSL